MMTSGAVSIQNTRPVQFVELESTGQAIHSKTLKDETVPFPYKVPPYGYAFTRTDTGSSHDYNLALRSESVSAANALTSKEYQITRDRLRELKQDEDEIDRPSNYAYDRTDRLLRDLANLMGMQFPAAILATGPSQGIRLLWRRDARELRIIIGGSEASKSYLYRLESERSQIVYSLDPRTLQAYLNWLIQV